jgi:hypothetical protein
MNHSVWRTFLGKINSNGRRLHQSRERKGGSVSVCGVHGVHHDDCEGEQDVCIFRDYFGLFDLMTTKMTTTTAL